MARRIRVLDGPRPDLLGTRETVIYELLNAALAFREPLIEVHPSNIYWRETFRQRWHRSLAATGAIGGSGAHDDRLALGALAEMLEKADQGTPR